MSVHTTVIIGLSVLFACSLIADDGRVTNEIAYVQSWRAHAAKVEKFKKDIKQSADPVALAVEMAQDSVPYCAKAGMETLVAHWNDPRAEQTLSELSERGPRYIRDGLKTPAGDAYEFLLMVRARKRFDAVIGNANDKKAKTESVIEFIENNSDVMSPDPSAEDYPFVRMLLDELETSDSPEAIRIVLQSGLFRSAYAKKHAQHVIVYAKELRASEALANSALVEAVGMSDDPEAISLLEDWLKAAKSRGQKSYITSRLKNLRKRHKSQEVE